MILCYTNEYIFVGKLLDGGNVTTQLLGDAGGWGVGVYNLRKQLELALARYPSPKEYL